MKTQYVIRRSDDGKYLSPILVNGQHFFYHHMDFAQRFEFMGVAAGYALVKVGLGPFEFTVEAI